MTHQAPQKDKCGRGTISGGGFGRRLSSTNLMAAPKPEMDMDQAIDQNTSQYDHVEKKYREMQFKKHEQE
jgi:hypothetical protein